MAQARQKAFFRNLCVADTLEGRFEMIVLHMALVVGHLRRHGAEGVEISQALFDAFVIDMDRNLREMGVGDLGVPKRVKAMAQAFYGHAAQYSQALQAGNDKALALALMRNVYNAPDTGAGAVPTHGLALCGYVKEAHALLLDQSWETLSEADVTFPSPAAFTAKPPQGI